MRLGHSIALALVGWYLLLAPVRNGQILSAPLRAWRLTRSFDDASACENYKQQEMLFFHKGARGIDADTAKLNADLYADGLCIASDDPRLAK
jgi:hypothetical protein